MSGYTQHLLLWYSWTPALHHMEDITGRASFEFLLSPNTIFRQRFILPQMFDIQICFGSRKRRLDISECRIQKVGVQNTLGPEHQGTHLYITEEVWS